MQPSKATTKDLNNKAISGIDKHFDPTASIKLAGADQSPAAHKATLQAAIDAIHAADAVGAQWRQLVQVARVALGNARRVRASLKAYLIGVNGPTAVGILEDFGFTAPRPGGAKTTKAKTQSVAQAAATRKARHTMGKKQKKAIKGTIPASAGPTGG
jgi:hypothetical protein